tara:strand:- start:543 stop:917 length:375 start_codon:yes stop_codon:yes gene_type:complete
MVSTIGVGDYCVDDLRRADNEASAILSAAMRFAADRETYTIHDDDDPYPTYAADRDMLVVQHVKIQLACLATRREHLVEERERLVECAADAATALKTLAKAHAEDGVRVKTTQPWHHRDDRKRD